MEEKEQELNQIADSFIHYVDQNMNIFKEENIDLEKICERHSIEYNNTMFPYKLREILINQCKEILGSKEQFSRNNLRDLADHLVLKYLVENMDIQPYFQILRSLNNILQNGIMIVSMENELVWNKIICSIMDIIKLEEEQFDLDNEIRKMHAREYIVGKSAQYLKGKGYRMSVSNNRIVTEDFVKIAQDIESLVISLGGVNVAERLFEMLQPFYDPKQKRYQIIRNTVTLNRPVVNSQYPFGYLIQLCVKNFVKYNDSGRQFEKHFKELLKLSQAFISIMDIQDYTMYRNMFFDFEKIASYLQNNILYDHAIAFEQWNPDYIPSLIKGLLTKFFDETSIANRFCFDLNDFVNISEKILKRGLNKNLIRLNRNQLYAQFPEIDSKTIDGILTLISHKRKKINKNYTLPTDISDFNKKPLIQINEDEFVLINPSFCSFAFFESISQAIRKVYPNFDGELGYELENYIKSKMDQKNIEYKTGFYGDNQQCDIVIETEERVVFIEVKKKPLTRGAMAGDCVNLFVDLSKSLIASQKQLGAHEIYLREKGEIVLRKCHSKKKSRNEKHEVIKYKNRIIDRVSIGFTEYGFLTDKLVVSAVLETVTMGSIHSIDPKREHELEQLNGTAQAIQKQAKLIGNQNSTQPKQQLYFDCAFFSLQQLLMLIDDSHSTDSFVENLMLTKHVTMGTNDFYYEYESLRRRRNVQSFRKTRECSRIITSNIQV